MKMTQAQATKMLKMIETENAMLLDAEYRGCLSSYFAGEEPIDTSYSFDDTESKLMDNIAKTEIIKHTINKHNVETILPGSDITIDTALIRMSALNRRISTIESMGKHQKVERRSGYSSGVSEYTVCFYDPDAVAAEAKAMKDEVIHIQLALDKENSNTEIEFAL